jgi:hypothetical protein
LADGDQRQQSSALGLAGWQHLRLYDMTNENTVALAGVRLSLRTSSPPSLNELNLAINSLNSLASMVEVRMVEETAIGGRVVDWKRIVWAVTDARVGSVTVDLVFAGLVGGAAVFAGVGNGLAGLMKFAEGIRDWGDNERRAPEVMAAVDLDVEEGEEGRFLQIVRGRQLDELITSVNDDLLADGHADVRVSRNFPPGDQLNKTASDRDLSVFSLTIEVVQGIDRTT